MDEIELLKDLRSWQREMGKANRKLLAILDVVDEMEDADDYSVRAYGERLRIIFNTRH